MKDLLMTIVENQHSKMMLQEQEAESHSLIGWDEVDGGLYLVSGTSSLQKGTISNEDDDDTIMQRQTYHAQIDTTCCVVTTELNSCRLVRLYEYIVRSRTITGA